MLPINDIGDRIGGRPLFEHATAAIGAGWKVDFVGRNGTGKSTFLRLIEGEIQPDDGGIPLPPRRRIGRVDQEAPASNESLIEIALRCVRSARGFLPNGRTRRSLIARQTSIDGFPT